MAGSVSDTVHDAPLPQACPAWASEHVEARWEAARLQARVERQGQPLDLAMLGDSITEALADCGLSCRRNSAVVAAEARLGGSIGVFGVLGE